MTRKPIVQLIVNIEGQFITEDDIRLIEETYDRIKSMRRVAWMRAIGEGKQYRWVAKAAHTTVSNVHKSVNKKVA